MENAQEGQAVQLLKQQDAMRLLVLHGFQAQGFAASLFAHLCTGRAGFPNFSTRLAFEIMKLLPTLQICTIAMNMCQISVASVYRRLMA